MSAPTSTERASASQLEKPVAARPLVDTTPVSVSPPDVAKTATPAPPQQGHVNSPPTRLGVLPQAEASSVVRPTNDAASGAVTPAERRASAPPPAQGHAGAPSAKLYAVPQAGAPAPRSTEPERAVPQRLAAIPPQTATPRKPTATDAPPVLVLRGGPPSARYAHVGKPVPPQSVIKVVRGARPLPTGLEGIVQPSALLLRVPD